MDDMLKLFIKLLILFVVAFGGGSVVYGDVNDLAAESLSVFKRVEELGAEKSEATRSQNDRLKEVRSRLKELSPEIVLSYNRQIREYTEYIESYKKKIAELQSKIDKIEKGNPADDKPEIDRLNAENDKLNAEQSKLAGPFDVKIKKIKQIPNDKNAAYKEAMGKFCLTPGKDYAGVVKTNIMARVGGTIFSYNWDDAKGKRVAWTHIRLRDKPVIPPGAKKLDDTYFISSHSKGSIWVWAGHYQICLVMNNKEWQGKENLAKAVKAFIDLKGLAEIDATGKGKKKP